ncbi:MAG: propionate kinase [Candidatus Hydrothermota bacterium]|nr:MAG: propionate kinase [Candidatus Hydrothermae bacterium]
MKILTLNCGSSSVKYQVFDWTQRITIAKGIAERVTVGGSFVIHEVPGREKLKVYHECPDHREAIRFVLDILTGKVEGIPGVIEDVSEIKAVGHRVVHGGERYAQSVLITDEVLKTFEELSDLAPLHNPANVLGIRAAKAVLPDIPHVAVMDTAFHQTMPEHAYIYAIPYEWYVRYKIRRYGFHGTSHLYVSRRAAALLGKDPKEVNVITCHIGNGASVAAVKNGVSIDTSMGFTPLEGLVMGTRSGDIDPAIIGFIEQKEGKKAPEIVTILNKKSGILGITGKFVDRRDIEERIKLIDKIDQLKPEEAEEVRRAYLAFKIEAYRIRKYIGAYAFVLGHVDAIVFTAGVGEMWPELRAEALKGLDEFGIKIDPEKNRKAKSRNAEFDISAEDSKVKVFVIPTDEELVIAEDTVAIIEGRYKPHTEFRYSFQDPNYVNKLREEARKRELGLL